MGRCIRDTRLFPTVSVIQSFTIYEQLDGGTRDELNPQASGLTPFLLYPNTSSHSGADSIRHWMLSSYLALRGTLPSNYAAADFPSDLFMAYGI